MNVVQKALLIPVNDKQELFIQDRRGFKKPDWGFFGGSVEEGETFVEAVIRETQEELDIKITEGDLVFLGESKTEFEERHVLRHLFLYRTNQKEFNVLEGQGGQWMDFSTAQTHLNIADRFEEIKDWIEQRI